MIVRRRRRPDRQANSVCKEEAEEQQQTTNHPTQPATHRAIAVRQIVKRENEKRLLVHWED